jgi:hypothetical protein
VRGALRDVHFSSLWVCVCLCVYIFRMRLKVAVNGDPARGSGACEVRCVMPVFQVCACVCVCVCACLGCD